MSSNHLKLYSDKTQFIWLGSRKQIKKIKFRSVPLGSDTVSFQSSINNLGVVFDDELFMKEHILRLCRTSFYQLRQLRVIRQSLTYETCIILVHAVRLPTVGDACSCKSYLSKEKVRPY